MRTLALKGTSVPLSHPLVIKRRINKHGSERTKEGSSALTRKESATVRKSRQLIREWGVRREDGIAEVVLLERLALPAFVLSAAKPEFGTFARNGEAMVDSLGMGGRRGEGGSESGEERFGRSVSLRESRCFGFQQPEYNSSKRGHQRITSQVLGVRRRSSWHSAPFPVQPCSCG